MKTNNNFYDSASIYYDKMIDFNSALQKRKILLSNFVDDKMKSVADVGCGTGVDSISLSQLGLNVTAFDPSIEMINTAKENCKRLNAKIDFYNYFAALIPKPFYSRFDLVVSLGNTIANITSEHLEKSFVKFYKMLKDEGKVLIQILNYEKIQMEKERIVNITKKDDDFFVRFYDFGKNDLTFNILKFNSDQTSQKELISTKICPHTTKDLKIVFKEVGFKKIEMFGGLDKKSFDTKTSNDLVLLAIK